MNSPARWQPLVEANGAQERRGLREQVIEALLSIARALRVPLDDLGPGRPPIHSVNVSDGSAGTALLFAHLSRASQDDPALGDPETWRRVAEEHLEHAIQGVANIPMGPGLFAGFTGVGWAMAHVARVLGTEADATDEMDEALLELVGTRPWRGAYDLVSGLVGFGVYALERLPDPMAERCLDALIARLDESAHRDAHGLTWHTPAARLLSPRRETWPGGLYDLGVAHGLPGVIALLAECCAAGVARERARPLLDGAVSWLRAHALAEGARGFPWAHIPGVPAEPARSAWCYGDPGIAAVLLRASACVGEPTWVEEARALALGVVSRPSARTGIADTSVCHGSVGLLHLLNRLYQGTGAPELREAVRTWLEWTLAARVDGADTVAGFRALTHEQGQPHWIAERGLLNGAAGVGLGLLATVSAVPPTWDRLLLMSGGT